MLLRKGAVPQLLPIVAVCCVLLIGCESRRSATPPENVTIAITKNLNPFLVKTAVLKGFFQEEGVNVTLEGQGRWAIRNGLTDRSELPNFFEALYIEGLQSVEPDAVRIIKRGDKR